MTKTPITLQDLRRRLYVKAKAEPTRRFWGLYTHVCKRDTLRAAYEVAKQNDGAPGVDGVTFEAIEVEGVDAFLDQLREELVQRNYRPLRPGTVGIPKEGGKVRQLSIPSIRDRVVPGSVETHPGTDLRSRRPTGVLWLPAQAVRSRGGPTCVRGHPPGEDPCHRPGPARLLRYRATPHRTGEGGASGQ
jgi:hypothetical protein